MIHLKTRKARLSFAFSIVVVSISIVFFLLRGPYLSNSIKRMIIPVLENVSRERIIIDKAVINLFPFYVQAKGFKMFDKDGNRMLWITKTRAYIDLLGLLSKEVRIRRLTMIEPDLTAGEDDLKRILESIRKSSSVGEKGNYSVTLKNIKLTEGTLKDIDIGGATNISGSGLSLNMNSRRSGSVIEVILKEWTVSMANGSMLDGGFEGQFRIEDRKIAILRSYVHTSLSTIDLSGELSLSPEGSILDGIVSGAAAIHVDTINNVFALKRIKEGVLKLDGSVKLAPNKKSKWPIITFDLKTKSDFYLETLMEIVKVEDNIAGLLHLDGNITGTFPDIRGKGTAVLHEAVFDTLPVDDMRGEITYRNQKFSLNNFVASSYEGKLNGSAHILIPNGDYYVEADVSGVNSVEFFRYIGWEPSFQKGRIDGHFVLNQEYDHDILVNANVNYANTTKTGDDVYGRLETILATLELEENVLTLKDTVLSSMDSALLLDGDIDLNNDTLKLEMLLDSKNAADLTAPDYERFTAPIRFTGRAVGPLNDPEITGRLEADAGTIHGMSFDRAFADLTYSMRKLSSTQISITQDQSAYDISGTIDFRDSVELFTFKSPYYRAKASVERVSITPFITAAYIDMPITGYADGTLSFEGDSEGYEAHGTLAINNGIAYGQPYDIISLETSLSPDKIQFHSLVACNGKSTVNAEGELFFNKQYKLLMSSNRISLDDVPVALATGLNGSFGLKLRGEGTIDKPALNFSMMILDSDFGKIEIGKGKITGRLKDKELSANGSFIEGLVTADAKATFADPDSWSADIKFDRGEYGFLLSQMLPDPPRDLSASLKGRLSFAGRGDSIFMKSKFSAVNMSLYGYNFRNIEPIALELKDEDLTIKSFVLEGDNANLMISGTLQMNKEYNLNVIGDMDISPLRALTDKLASLRGRGEISVHIMGQWDNPELVGDIKLSDASVAISDFPYKIGPMSGAIYLNRDRLTFDSLSTDFAGGNILLSGAGYFKDLAFTRLYVSSDIEGVKIRPTEGISTVLDGKLFYESSLTGSSLTGDIDVEKARFEQRIEWKSWLLGLKEIKEERVEYPSFLSETLLNIRIVSDNIYIDNNIARTPVTASVNLTGTVGEYGLIGRMEANEGSVYFRSNEFNILEGSSIDFVKPGSIEPLFHVIADTYASDYYIRLSLDGTIDRFSLTLYSDPPLTESEILSLLTFGQLDKEAKGIESGIAAGEATAFLTGSLQDKVEEEFKYLTGLERFEIEPHTTTEGAFIPRVTVSKRLFEDQIYVTYSSSVSTEEQIIKVEYKLNENLSLIGSRNEIGSAGMDFKYRFEFR